MRAFHVKTTIAAALAIVAALAVAATVRPPRAAPAMQAIAPVSEPAGRVLPHTRSGAPRRLRARRPHHRRAPPAPIAPIDLNRADAAAFARIPGIDRRLAERIVVFRALNGPFESLDELGDVDGFSSRRIDHIAPYLLVRIGH